MNKIKKVLIANRGEIAIRIMRACKELDIKTVAIYSKEDIGTLHRQKADESYLIGEGLEPTQAYLDIEGIIRLAKEKNVDAIHPGYGFLSENQTFAKRCQEEGIIFIGPEIKHLQMFGDKTSARETAIKAGIPVVPGTKGEIQSAEEAKDFADKCGYPVILKAVSGGGGKGMRIVENEKDLEDAYDRVKSEAIKSFGNDALYVEKYINNPEHIEVQILGDQHGNVVHLYERDCSIQRRHQKLVEVAPSFNMSADLRQRLTDAALQLMENVDYVNAGTVEFLVNEDDFYFIEVNPRVQVEHTITEIVTGIDIVKSQILIADGESLFGDRINMPAQEDIPLNGFAIQCRITTEDPLNNFAPDSGSITSYQSPGGYGVRLDAGDAYTGAKISPYYDSLLVKISTYANTLKEAIDKMARALDELRVRGIKTNTRFLQNIMENEDFATGNFTTKFIDNTPELFKIIPARDRGSKVLNYLGNVTVNGFPGVPAGSKPDYKERIFLQKDFRSQEAEKSRTYKHILDQEGPSKVIESVLAEKDTLLTDTTLRDAHQSLISTRLRTTDMLGAAPYMNHHLNNYFSFEMWGGATFDVAYNFLRESPWDRLVRLREAMPDVLFQMLFRASNAVGYSNYPDNVVRRFLEESAQQGIDVFRIFDSLNWLEAMKVSIEAGLETGKLVEGAICYTGDILNPERSSIYTLDYYVNLAKEIEAQGVHLLAIKDMSGILKPEAAYQLVSALKSELKIPIHLHTHDTSANALTMYSRAIDAGVDIVDTANEAFSGLTSQPNASSLAAAREGTDRQVITNIKANEDLAEYWKVTRSYYQPFESDLKAPWPAVYEYEMPGGQYTNFEFQAASLGLGDRFDEILSMYKTVNQLLGDITKVTPSSKVVGDMALFMVQNDLDEETVLTRGKSLDFPASVIEFMRGDIGQPPAGMNKELQAVVLKNETAYTERPGQLLPDYDFNKAKETLTERSFIDVAETMELSYALYPKVYEKFLDFYDDNGMIWNVNTPAFFHGLHVNETLVYELEPGKTLVIELISVGPTKANGFKTIHFEVNGLSYRTEIFDLQFEGKTTVNPKAEKSNPNHVAASMPGQISTIKVKVGDKVEAGQLLLVTEAMKMENSIQAPHTGVIKAVHAEEGAQVAAGDLLVEVEK